MLMIVGFGITFAGLGIYEFTEIDKNKKEEEKVISESSQWEPNFYLPDEKGNHVLYKKAYFRRYKETNSRRVFEKFVPYIDDRGNPNLRLDQIESGEIYK